MTYGSNIIEVPKVKIDGYCPVCVKVPFENFINADNGKLVCPACGYSKSKKPYKLLETAYGFSFEYEKEKKVQ